MPAGTDFLGYLSCLYNFLISVVGLVAMGVIVYGGMRYVVSAGNPAAMEDAKEAIWSAVYGLALALGSWLIINVVNPDILVLKNPGVGLPGGAYAYNQNSMPKCFTGTGNLDLYSASDGIQSNPCQCLDGTPQYSIKTRTNLTLSLSPTNPPPSAPAGSMTALVKLTDDKGQGIGGKTIKMNRVNAALNASNNYTVTTAPDGSFTLTTPVPCSDIATRQAVFDGDTTYTFAVSNPITLTIGGTPACVAGDYVNSPAIGLILPVSFCQNLCSDTTGNFADDGKFHCAVAKLGVGRFLSDAEGGNNLLVDPTVDKDQPIFYDALTNTRKLSGYPIGKIGVNLDSGFWSSSILVGYQYMCIFDPVCKGLTESMGCNKYHTDVTLLNPSQDGKFIVKQTNVGTIAPVLTVFIKNPSTGACDDIVIEDRNVLIKVAN